MALARKSALLKRKNSQSTKPLIMLLNPHSLNLASGQAPFALDRVDVFKSNTAALLGASNHVR